MNYFRNFIENPEIITKEGEVLIDGFSVNLEIVPLDLRKVYEEILEWQRMPIGKQVRFYLEKNYFESRLIPTFSEYLFDHEIRKNDKLIEEVWKRIIPRIFYSGNVRVTAKSFASFLDYYENRCFYPYHHDTVRKERESIEKVILSLEENLRLSLGHDYKLIVKNLGYYDETYVLGTYAKAMVKFSK